MRLDYFFYGIKLSIPEQRKKIVIVGPAFPYRGGNSLFVSHLYDSLVKDFDVEVVNFSLLYPSFLFPGSTQFDESNSLIKKTPNKRLINSINPFTWLSTARYIKSLKPDLIAFDWWQPFFGPAYYIISSLLRSHFKNKILFITENVISHESRAIDKMLTGFGLKHASSFLALSGKVASDLEMIRAERPVYRSELPVYNCYNFSGSFNRDQLRTKLGYKPEHKVMLFFGYIRKYKGLDLLLHATRHLVQGDPTYRLLIVGESYENIEDYTSLIKQLGIENTVTLIEKFIPNEEVGNYYVPADVVVLPYRSGTQSGILNVAYGFNKPVVVTDVGGLAESLIDGKTGILVKKPNPVAIAESIKHFFEIQHTTNFTEEIEIFVKNNGFNTINETFRSILAQAQ